MGSRLVGWRGIVGVEGSTVWVVAWEGVGALKGVTGGHLGQT